MRVASYNILAHGYLLPERYPQVAAAMFDWERRREAVLERILGLDADVVCLQEVEAAAFEFLQARLGGRGYVGVYAQKQARRDGCATFLRRPRFADYQHSILYYRDHPGPADPAGHLALIVALRDGGRELRIANTHLRWGRRSDRRHRHIGYRQARELLQLIEPAAGWLVCGDFNAAPGSDLVALLEDRGLIDPGVRLDMPTISANGRARRIDYLFHTPDLEVTLEPPPPIDGATILPAPGEPSDHLPLAGVVNWRPASADPGATA